VPEPMAVVIVHGAFVDGSGWEGVHGLLQRDGYTAAIVQNPTITLAQDVDATRRVIAEQEGRVLLVGHAYGGAVITEAGRDPQVAGLVYVTGFAPDEGESVATLLGQTSPDQPVPPMLAPQDDFFLLDRAKFAGAFAADVEPGRSAFMAASQVPFGIGALTAAVGQPSWKVKPSWYLVAGDDRMISPSLQRFMSRRAGSTVVEASGSHAIYVSQPIVVAAMIDKAASEMSPTPPGERE